MICYFFFSYPPLLKVASLVDSDIHREKKRLIEWKQKQKLLAIVNWNGFLFSFVCSVSLIMAIRSLFLFFVKYFIFVHPISYACVCVYREMNGQVVWFPFRLHLVFRPALKVLPPIQKKTKPGNLGLIWGCREKDSDKRTLLRWNKKTREFFLFFYFIIIVFFFFLNQRLNMFGAH